MKILLTYASAGAGHMKAAEAVYRGIQNTTSHEVAFVDGLDRATPFSRNLYRESYKLMISYIPSIWGFFFALADIECLQGLYRAIRRIINAIQFSGLEKFLIQGQFDYIISTHFMTNEVASSLKRKGKISSKIISVVTDYDVHRIWTAPFIDIYAVASDWTREKMARLQVPAEKVVVTGIPTDEKFSISYDIAQLKQKFGLNKDAFTVLMATGSFGIGPIEDIVRALKGFQVIVVCGHNKVLYKRLSAKAYPFVKVMGLVDNMHELMAVSNVMLTKPGGLSVSEALVSQLPLVFFNAIPGQEEGNVKVLKHYGLGSSPKNIRGIVEELHQLRNSRDALMTLLKRTKTIARPSAVKDIISLLK